MKILTRFTLLGAFAAVGVGVAVCLGISTTPPASEKEAPTPESAAARAGSSGREEDSSLSADHRFATIPGKSGQPLAGKSGKSVSGYSEPLVERRPIQPDPFVLEDMPDRRVVVAPPAPLPAPVSPARTQQFPPELDKARLEQVFEQVRQQMTSGPALSAAPAPPAPLPPPLPSQAVAAPNPAPPVATVTPARPIAAQVPARPSPVAAPPAARRDPAPSPLASAQAKPVRGVPKAVVQGAGDGKLAIHIQNADIHEVLDLMSEQGNLNILAGKSVQGKVSATLNGVDIDSALAAILKSTGYVARREGKFIFVGTPEEFDSLEQSLDKVGTRVFRPNYMSAADLQALITPILTPKTGVVSVSTPSKSGIATDDSTAEGNAFAGGEVVVVRDYEAVLAQVDQLVTEVDVRPLQVAIEAMILSIKLNDENRFGVDFQLLRNKQNIRFASGSPLTDLAKVTFDGGLKFGFLDSSLGVFLDALETTGDVAVIATPRLMVVNKHRAEILIGAQKGYVNTTQTETSVTQNVQFLDIGAQLRLRPFISSDGLIRMEVHPELSDGNVEVKGNFTLPNKEVTKVTTNIMIRDGCTVVIGGLMRDTLTNTTTGIPLLGSLPLVGVAFRHSDETIERREVLVLITPRIVYEPGTCKEGDKAACEFHRRQSVYTDKLSCLGKRSIARRYVRLAQSAYAAGDRDAAMRFAEMAVHFDPLSRAAIDLRSDIWLGKPAGDHTLQAPGDGPSGNPLDGQQISPLVLGDLEHEPVSQPAPSHPFDPGRPGGHTDLTRPRKLQ